jgi:hypothetical protein
MRIKVFKIPPWLYESLPDSRRALNPYKSAFYFSPCHFTIVAIKNSFPLAMML